MEQLWRLKALLQPQVDRQQRHRYGEHAVAVGQCIEAGFGGAKVFSIEFDNPT